MKCNLKTAVMSNLLQPPATQKLGKRPSDDDLGNERLDEKRASNEVEINFALAERRVTKDKTDWVQRGLVHRQKRIMEFYCCECDEIKLSWDGGKTCHSCTYSRCIFCLQHD